MEHIKKLAETLATIKTSEAKQVNAILTAQNLNWGIYVRPLTGGGDHDNDADDGVGGIQDDPTHPDS